MKLNNADREYLKLCQHILDHGVKKADRTGTGTLSAFGYQMRFNLQEGFPLLTTKKLPFRVIAEELLWFLSGSTDVRKLIDKHVNIWTPDATRWFNELNNKEHTQDEYVYEIYDKNWTESYRTNMANLGPIYGKQWRAWDGVWSDVDQIKNVIESIKNNPDSRRHLVSAWNVGDLQDMALPPCHYAFQFYVANGKLSCMFNMRSSDVFLGLPFNIASYALLTHMIAHVCELEVGELIYTGADVHIYLNHVEQVKEQLKREPRKLPKLFLESNIDDIDEFKIDHIDIWNYNPHPAIKGEVSV